MSFSVSFFLLGFFSLVVFSFGEGVADPEVHSYADFSKSREHHLHSDHRTNEARLYDFYQRQADFYLAMSPQERPKLLPAYPGLDAGLHGHWGKHNQNSHKDGRWNQVKIGSMHTQVMRGPKKLPLVIKGVNVKLDDSLAACFDPDTLHYRAVWQGWIAFNPFRWGCSRNASFEGELLFTEKKPRLPQGGKFLGTYRHGESVIFHYRIGEVEILDSPSAKNGEFVRTVEVISGGGESSLPKLFGPTVTYGQLSHLTQGGPSAWPETVTTAIEMGKPLPNSPYAIDTFVVPYQNPHQSVMQLTGIAFGPDETIYVSTLVGEVWSVREHPTEDSKVIWRRFASGFNSPMGLHCDQDGLFALDRGQIYRFHDLNEDGEADYYENYASDFRDEGKSHTHTFGLHRTADGAFYFTQKEQIMRTSPERETSEIGYGIRNGMGIGGDADSFWVGPQEGNWTPASTIIEVENGKHYGIPKGKDPKPISAPLCFIPRGIDNSTGGFVEITSDRWGPYQGSHVGLSFGSCSHYLILQDQKGPQPQAATVPLEGDFLAGVLRGAFRKSDGQLYVVGLDGWGDYSLVDGCLQRVRYLEQPITQPKSFEVFENGIRVDFPVELDGKRSAQAGQQLAQTWEYIFSKGYGSLEFSAHSDQVGHDLVAIHSVHALADSQSLFFEMPDLDPTMVLYLRMNLMTAEGAPFAADLFASAMYPQPHFDFPGALPPRAHEKKEVALRVKKDGSKKKRKNSKVIEGARELVVNAVSGLRYDKKILKAKAGEALAFKLVNKDVMPHNLVIVSPGALQKVGEASFKMLNNPKASELNYAPKMPEVRWVIPVIDPDQEESIYFYAPRRKGDYPYMCTFPGHWQAMQGVLRVE